MDFGNFDLKVVQFHSFWLIFCLQALFDLPDSILIVPRPQKAKKDQKRSKTKNHIKNFFDPPPVGLFGLWGFGVAMVLGGVAMDSDDLAWCLLGLGRVALNFSLNPFLMIILTLFV